jgi:hypothetical protein
MIPNSSNRGSAFRRSGQILSTTTFGETAGVQSFSIPAGAIYLDIELFGGGGGGQRGVFLPGPRGGSYNRGRGGGGGAYVRHIYYGNNDMQAGDTINFSVGHGGTAGIAAINGAAGGDTILENHKRDTTIIFAFGITAGGGAAGLIGFGGTAAGGNVTNRNGDISLSDLPSQSLGNGTTGGNGGCNDIDFANSSCLVSGGTGGIAASSTPPAAGVDSLISLRGGGGGGGGYSRSTSSPTTTNGATGGLGAVRIRVYG